MFETTTIDTETTGMEPHDVVIEMAAVRRDWHYHFMVNPGDVPVVPEARAAHHITDAELAVCATAEVWLPTVMELTGRPDHVLVFHNAEFDTRMIQQTWPQIGGAPHICTYRCSLQLWPDAPSHSNQVLRYWLSLHVEKTRLHPHRALPDALVTHALVMRMIEDLVYGRNEHVRLPDLPAEELRDAAIERLVHLTTAPVVLHRVRFGKHQGLLWKDVPRDYLQWIIRQADFDRDVLHTARTLIGSPPATPAGEHAWLGQRFCLVMNLEQDGFGSELGDYTAHQGQVVTVTRELPDSMVAVQASDGWVGNVFKNELRAP
jgi:exodeoxyribonuclease X